MIAAAAAAGGGSAVFGTFWTTVMQQRVAPELLGRTTAFTMTGSFALGSLGWTVMGSVASLVGTGRLLGFAAAYATVSSAVVLAAPAIRAVRWQDMARR